MWASASKSSFCYLMRSMRGFLIFFFGLCCFSPAQESFQLPPGVDKMVIQFELVANMILLEVEVNGTTMDFVLDTGAPSTSILNLTGVDSLSVGEGNVVRSGDTAAGSPCPQFTARTIWSILMVIQFWAVISMCLLKIRSALYHS